MPAYARYVLLGITIAIILFLAIAWVPDLGLWFTILLNAHSPQETVLLSFNLFALALSDASWSTTLFNALIALLVGANLSLLYFYYKKYQVLPGTNGMASGVVGTIATILGFGCASCGTLFLSLILTTIGGSSVALNPFINSFLLQGIGVALLLFSTYKLLQQIQRPPVCLT